MADQIPAPPVDYSQADMSFALQVVEQRLTDLERIIAEGYSVTNGVTVRTLDVSTATLTDVARFVGTLAADLRARGMLG